MASKAAPSKTKSHQPLHNFPIDLRWTATDQVVADPAPAVAEDDVVPGQGNSHKAVKKGCDSSNGKLSKKKGSSARVRGGGGGDGGEAAAASGGVWSERQRKVAEDKRKVWISLTKEEIEEDVYSMTGARPRRPRKRPRSVQKQLDNVFPGLNLVGMSAESYRVQELMHHK